MMHDWQSSLAGFRFTSRTRALDAVKNILDINLQYPRIAGRKHFRSGVANIGSYYV